MQPSRIPRLQKISFTPRDEAGRGIPRALGENSRANKGLITTLELPAHSRPDGREEKGQLGKTFLFPQVLPQVFVEK